MTTTTCTGLAFIPLALFVVVVVIAAPAGCGDSAAISPTCPQTMAGWPIDRKACNANEEGTSCTVESGAFRCHYQACSCHGGLWHCTDTGPGCNDMAMPPDLGPPDLGPSAMAGALCNGAKCGPGEFCMVFFPGAPRPNDLGTPTAHCSAVPDCINNPTCACFTTCAGCDCYHAACFIMSDVVSCVGQ